MIIEGSILKRNNFIGKLGEMCLTQCVPYAYRTREKDTGFLENVPFSVPEPIKEFLKKYWYTIDAFRFAPGEQYFLEIFEIKTTGVRYVVPEKYKLAGITQRQRQAYQEAQTLNIKITDARVSFLSDWNVRIEMRPFSFDNYIISEGGPNSKIKNKIPRD